LITQAEYRTRKPVVNQSVVVRGEEGGNNDSYTITSVKVQKVLKGKFKEQQIKVLQPATIVKESNQPPFISTIRGYSPMKKSIKYLLFLSELDHKIFPNMRGVYSIISVNQGKFNLDRTDSRETELEAEDEQYADLKAKVRKKYEAMVNALP
jgi:hypothetical protein